MNEEIRKEVRATSVKYAAIAMVVFAAASFSRTILFSFSGYAEWVQNLPRVLNFAEQPLRWTLIVLFGLFVAHRMGPWRALGELGLRAPIGRALIFAFVATLPMVILPFFIGTFNRDVDPLWVLFSAAFWPLGEEILFRGYVFRQLHRRAGWGLWTAALTSSVIFGTVHLSAAAVQQQSVTGQLGTVAMITVLSLFGAWLFTRWDENLWVMVGFHGFMNLWWAVFDLGETALGGILGNVTRLGVVVIAIVITVYRTPIEKALSNVFSRTGSTGSEASEGP